jgi:transposase InsO family protein
LKKDLALAALRHATIVRNPAPGLIHHSDRGSQYCFDNYQRFLKAYGVIAAKSGKGNCVACPRALDLGDSAKAETVFKTIKSELVWLTRFQTRHQAENALAATSTASKIQPDVNPRSAANRRSHSRQRWPK